MLRPVADWTALPAAFGVVDFAYATFRGTQPSSSWLFELGDAKVYAYFKNTRIFREDNSIRFIATFTRYSARRQIADSP